MQKLLTSLLLLFSICAFAQAPERISYQGVARDNAGLILANQAIGLKIKLRSVSINGTVVYDETHSVSTNAFGLFNVQIGGGVVQSGTFATINWGGNTYYIETLMDATGGTSYTSLGTQQLVSVPYALHSKTSESSGTGNGSNAATLIYTTVGF